MLRVDRRPNGDELIFVLTGHVNESVNFPAAIGSPPAKICINTRHVKSVNSTGLKGWLSHAERLIDGGCAIRYAECSPAFTRCVRLFIAPRNLGRVDSVMGPFKCTKCGHVFEKIIRTQGILEVKPQITPQICLVCQGPANFDEVPSEYFAFLV